MSLAKTDNIHCMYCAHQGGTADFDDEHVVSRALCGRGENWTLRNCVCKACNKRFSTFENELLHNAVESLARGFSGPLGRSAKGKAGPERLQPLRINHLYVQNKDDNLIYEGGFSFPAEFYFRPQMIDAGNGQGLLSLVGSKAEVSEFQDAIDKLVKGPKLLTLQRLGSGEYQVARFGEINGSWQVSDVESSVAPSGVFFRKFPDRPFAFSMTTRLAQNDDGKLFFRSTELDSVGTFLDQLFANDFGEPRSLPTLKQGDQTFFFAFEPDAEKVYKAVIKTGVNLVGHFYGADAVRDPAFEGARNVLLEEASGSNATRQWCRLWTDTPPDFPVSSIDEHRFMLDVNGDKLRFRMRLYGSLGYTSRLANFTTSLAARMSSTLPRCVSVDYAGYGIRETAVW
jgi:HNH endonuclease